MGSRFCNNCGAAHSASGAKKPALAAALSLFIPGLGQSYNGNALKGTGIFLGIALLWILSLLMYSEALFIGTLVLWILGVYDAYRDAGRVNRGEIPEKKHQMLLFGGVVVVAVVVFAVILFLFILSAFASIFAPVVCVEGKGCLIPLEGEAVCNTPGECIGSAQTRIEVHYYKDAMKFLDRALVLDPTNTRALTLMGVTRAKSGDITGAIIPLDRAVAIDPNLSAAWENRGIVQAMSGNAAASLTDFETAVTLPGNSSLAWYNLGVARSLEGNASGAADTFYHALLIDKNCTSCQMMRGKALIELGQYDAALGIFNTVTTYGLVGIESKQEKGKALAGLGRYHESCSAFDASIDAYPFYVTDIWSRVCNGTTNRCEPLRTTAEPQTAYDREFNIRLLAEYDDQLRQRQDDPDLWIKRGETLIDLMRYDEAVIAFGRSLSIGPGNAQALNGKGIALFYKGDNASALDAFFQAASADPGFINPRNNRAFVLMKQGQYVEAAQVYQEALDIARQRTDPKGTADFMFETAF